MEFHPLPGVCNGGFLWNFPNQNWTYVGKTSFDEQQFKTKVKEVGKAILIVYSVTDEKAVSKKQTEVIGVLEKYTKNKEGFVARKLSHWSKTGDLWMVRWIPKGETWETSE